MRLTMWAGLVMASGAICSGCESFESTYVGNAPSGTQFSGVPVVVQRAKFIKVVDKAVTYVVVRSESVPPSKPASEAVKVAKVKAVPGAEPEADNSTSKKAASGVPKVDAPPPNPSSSPPSDRPRAPMGDPSEVVNGTRISELGERQTVTEVTFEVVSVPELFTVDIKRPAAGTATNFIEFEQGQQFPKKYSMDVEDKTIDAVGDLVTKLTDAAKKFFTASTRGEEPQLVQVVKIGDSVSRIRLYRIEDFLSAKGDLSTIKPVFDSSKSN